MMSRLGTFIGGAALGLFLTVTTSAAAQEGPPPARDLTGSRPAIGFEALRRPTGIAEVGVGWLTLPLAEVCVERTQAGCRKGDTSFQLEGWQLFRIDKRWAFGAGILLALISTTEAPRVDPGSVDRNHSRQYMTAEGTVRYYPYVGESVEWWVGMTGGLVVVRDRFDLVEGGSEQALLGPGGATLRTEGSTLGIAGGPVVALTENWALGGSFRYSHWFLPNTPAADPLGTEASLTGRNIVFSFGINVAFRLAL